MLAFVFNEALRDLRRAGRVGVSAMLLIALSLAALGAFGLFSLNLGRAIAQWRDDTWPAIKKGRTSSSKRSFS